jgi:hypothetical protein
MLAVAIGLWVVAAVMIPRFTPIDAATAEYAAAGMVLANALGLTLARPNDRFNRSRAMGVALKTLAGIVVLALAVAASAFERYATPGLILIGGVIGRGSHGHDSSRGGDPRRDCGRDHR